LPSHPNKRNVGIRRRGYLAVAAVVAVAVSSGCSGSGDGHATESPTAKPTPTVSEAQLRKEALAKLTPSARILMHGVKTAKGGLPETGIHVTDSKPYVFEAACAGSGKMGLYRDTKAPHSGPIQVLTCGGDVLTSRFQGGDLVSVRLQTPSATGVLAWQVIPQTP
jgi:hypothetical protein